MPLIFVWALVQPHASPAEPVKVRYAEGVLHGFLAVSTLDGKAVGSADVDQVPRGDTVTTHMVVRFQDGSVSDEKTVFTQNGTFRLVSYELVQKGPTFPEPVTVALDVPRREVTVTTTGKDGKDNVLRRVMDLPLDLANGMVPFLVKNLPKERQEAKVTMLATTPKPLLVTLRIRRAGAETFGAGRRATRFRVKVEIPGIVGFLASLLGKEPPDAKVLVYESEAPSFVSSEAPLYLGGPVLRTELVSPSWPGEPLASRGTSGR